MTDGCGFANRAAMRALSNRVIFGPNNQEPTAVQCRIGGAKGILLIRHDLSDDDEKVPMVWLRPSQIKIHCTFDPDTDPAMRTIDMLRASQMYTPARLSVETITNLVENSVPHDYFQRQFKLDLEVRVGELLGYEKEGDTRLLWHAIARESRVMPSRLAREAPGAARAKGLVSRDYDGHGEQDEVFQDALDEVLWEQSSMGLGDPVSGCPAGLAEICLMLLVLAFPLETTPVLQDALKKVAKTVIAKFKTRYQFLVPMSCSALIVPGTCQACARTKFWVGHLYRVFRSLRCAGSQRDSRQKLTEELVGPRGDANRPDPWRRIGT